MTNRTTRKLPVAKDSFASEPFRVGPVGPVVQGSRSGTDAVPQRSIQGIRLWSRSQRTCWSLPAFGWVVSFAVHAGIAAVFLLTSLSVAPPPAVGQTPIAAVQRNEQHLRADPVISDLKVQPLEPGELVPDDVPLPVVTQEIPVTRPADDVIAVFDNGSSRLGSNEIAVTAGQLYRTSFCGASGAAQRICYVVDCSGSMIIAFDYVRAELRRAIGSLSPAQYFHVVFYAAGSPLELRPYRLVRADARTRRRALEFVDEVELAVVPGGEAASQAVVAALRRALEVTATDGRGADLIYLLTDGQFDHQVVRQNLKQAQDQRKQPARVNVIACGNRNNEKFLHSLAGMYQGQFRFVSDEQLAQIPAK